MPGSVDSRVAPVLLRSTVERDRCVMATMMFHELAFLVTEFHVHQGAPGNVAAVPCNDANQMALLFFAPHGTFYCPKRQRPLSVAVEITPTAIRTRVGTTLEDTAWATDFAMCTLAATDSYDHRVRAAALKVLRETARGYRCALFMASVPLEPLVAFLAVPDGSSVARMLTRAWGIFTPLRVRKPGHLPGHTVHPVRVNGGVLGVRVAMDAAARAVDGGERAEGETLAICPGAVWIIRNDHIEVSR